jgi:hypothetical protein
MLLPTFGWIQTSDGYTSLRYAQSHERVKPQHKNFSVQPVSIQETSRWRFERGYLYIWHIT